MKIKYKKEITTRKEVEEDINELFIFTEDNFQRENIERAEFKEGVFLTILYQTNETLVVLRFEDENYIKFEIGSNTPESLRISMLKFVKENFGEKND